MQEINACAYSLTGVSVRSPERLARWPHCIHDVRRFFSEYKSYQLVFVDESGCDTLAGVRRTGWTPRGLPAIQTARIHREQRHQILPAYTHNGIMHSRQAPVSSRGIVVVTVDIDMFT